MRTHGEHLRTLQRRVDFLKSREHKNSFDLAELGALEWAVVNLQPQRQWVGLTDEEVFEIHKQVDSMQYLTFGKAIEAKLKEKNGM
jgi:hypothetical protein